MKNPNAMATVLTEQGMGSLREETPVTIPSPTRIARIESIRQALALADYEDVPSSDLDEVVAPWFREAVYKWGKPAVYAIRINVREGHMSEMMAGKRPVALRHLIPLHEVPAAVQRLCAQLCLHAGLEPPQPKPTLTVDDLRQLALRLFVSNPTLTRVLLEEAALAKGAAPEEVLRLLAGERR